MDAWTWAVLLKPFGAVVFFFVAYLIARALYRLIPDGNVKRILYDKELRKRHPWKFGLGFALLGYGVVIAMVLIMGDGTLK